MGSSEYRLKELRPSKFEESTHNALFNKIETRLLISDSKFRIYEGFFNPQGDKSGIYTDKV